MTIRYLLLKVCIDDSLNNNYNVDGLLVERSKEEIIISAITRAKMLLYNSNNDVNLNFRGVNVNRYIPFKAELLNEWSLLEKVFSIAKEADDVDSDFFDKYSQYMTHIGERTVDYCGYTIPLDEDHDLFIDFIDFGVDSYQIKKQIKHKNDMINTTELRLGNYVYLRPNNDSQRELEIKKVFAINNDHVSLNGVANYCDCGVIYPIFLTEELLLTNCGFIENSAYCAIHPEFSNYGLGFERYYREIRLVNANPEVGIGKELKYLHELQNILFILTGRELEIKL